MRHVALIVILAAIPALVGCGSSDDEGPTCDAGEASEVCQVFALVNAERARVDLAPYVWDSALALAAQRHAEDMVNQGYFDHTSQDGRSFADRSREAGYDASPRGENIAAGYPTAEAVMAGWMSSDGHRSNILAGGSNEIGVGLHERHWVQVFGARSAR